MKRILILCILTILPVLLTFSQSLNLLSTGYTWSNFDQTFQTEDCCIFTYFIKFSSDSVLQATVYKKVLQSDDSIKNNWRTVGFVREDIQKGLYFRDMNNNEILLYHYNLKLNDTIKIPSVFSDEDSVSFVVKNIENVLIDGNIKQKYLLVYPEYHNFTETWIEGIGSLQGILNVGLQGSGSDPKLLCCFKDDVLIYRNENYARCYYRQATTVEGDLHRQIVFKIIPNPSDQEITIQFADEKQRKICIYNSSGILVATLENKTTVINLSVSNFQPGIYFVVPEGKNVKPQKFIKY